VTSKVFYDGACPICSREIEFYRRHGSEDRIDWVDIGSSESITMPSGLTREQGLARLHFMDHEGRLHDGARTFAGL